MHPKDINNFNKFSLNIHRHACYLHTYIQNTHTLTHSFYVITIEQLFLCHVVSYYFEPLAIHFNKIYTQSKLFLNHVFKAETHASY